MSKYFKQELLNHFTQAFINAHLAKPYQQYFSYRQFANVVTVQELREIEENILNLTRYILENDKLDFPSNHNNGYIHRAGKINSLDQNNGFFPLSKSLATGCPTRGTPLEPIWFNFTHSTRYLGLSQQEPYGATICRQIKNYGNSSNGRDKKFNMVLKLGTQDRGPNGGYYISRSLHIAINRTILIPIVRNMCTRYSLANFAGNLTYDFIMQNAANITLDTTVIGYDCDTIRYRGGTIDTLIRTYDPVSRTRHSIYNEDRIQIEALFMVLSCVEIVINNLQQNIFKRSFIDNAKLIEPEFKYTDKIRIIGWVVHDTVRHNGTIFPAEYAISIRNFAQPLRFQIFNIRQPNCQPIFYMHSNAGPQVIQNLPRINGGGLSKEGKDIEGKYIEGEEYYFSEKPESVESDIYQVFNNTEEEEEKKYTLEPVEFAKFIKEYGESQKTLDNKEDNEEYNYDKKQGGKIFKQKKLDKKTKKKEQKKHYKKTKKRTKETKRSSKKKV
jgi:hypothetical protein